MNLNEDFKFVDAHVHFYDMQHPTLYYGHWQPNEDHPFLGAQTRILGSRNYLAEDFIRDSQPHGVTKAIHVQAAIGSKDPVEETKWLQEVYQNTGLPNAIVGHVDLRDSKAEAVIEHHLNYPNFKGVRDFSHGEYLINDHFRRGYSLLEKFDLISSISAQWQDMENLADLAKTFPNTKIVLDHAGFPEERTTEYFNNWKTGMKKISDWPNIYCKISGLGMGDNRWTEDSIRPYVETCIELFGVDRSLFATNWPIDSLWSDYGSVVRAYRNITGSFSQSEVAKLFRINAESIYQI